MNMHPLYVPLDMATIKCGSTVQGDGTIGPQRMPDQEPPSAWPHLQVRRLLASKLIAYVRCSHLTSVRPYITLLAICSEWHSIR